MNIFTSDESPIVSAYNLDNKRVVKMVLESAQLLSTAIFLNTNTAYSDVYKPTHHKHPCAIWAAASLDNWQWLLEHFTALCREYSFRYNNKIHSTERLLSRFLEYRTLIQPGVRTPFANCTRSKVLQIDFTSESDPCIAYQKYLIAKWQHDKLMPKWTNRLIPIWYQEYVLYTK